MRRRLPARHLRISAQSALDEQVTYTGECFAQVSDACRTFRSSTISSGSSLLSVSDRSKPSMQIMFFDDQMPTIRLRKSRCS